MKRKSFFIFSAICVVVLALILAEVGLRIFERRFGISRGFERSRDPVSRALASNVRRRFERLWLRPMEKRPYPFGPPYDVFVNRGADDPQRMASIAERALEPKSGTWRAEDFLLPPEQVGASAYDVSINAFGFRDPERGVEKRPGTFRIVAYGTYTTFGFGLNDEDSYVRVLENTLGEKYGKKRHFEIWNGGRPGHTAIMGLARLEAEYEKIKPDLLIWDYGLVDMALRADMLPLGSEKRLRASPTSLLFYALRVVCPRSARYPIEICIRSIEYLTRVPPKEALEGWRDVYTRMIAFAKSHHLPVIMVRHFNYGIRAEEYLRLSDPANGIFFVNTSTEMAKPPPAEAIAEFWSQPNWTKESEVTQEEAANFPGVFYLKDALQFNNLGHKVIAGLLAQKMHEAGLLPQAKKKKGWD